MRFPRTPSAVAAVLVTGLLLLTLRPVDASAAAPYDLWYGVFFSTMKVGHAHFAQKPATYQGKAADETDATVDTKMLVLGNDIEARESSQSFADPATGAPLWEDVKMTSGGETTEVTATFYPTYIDAKLVSNGSATKKRVAIPPGTSLSSDDDASGFTSSKDLKVGASEIETVFYPWTLSLEKVGATVEQGDVPVFDSLTRKTESTWKVKVTSPEGSQEVFQDQDGNPVRIELPAGLAMLREGEQVALSDKDSNAAQANAGAPSAGTAPPATGGKSGSEYTPPIDFAVATAVDPSGEAVKDPRKCTHLSIDVTEPDKAPQMFDIHAIAQPADPTMTVADAAQQPDLAPDLADAPYLSLDSASIQDQAQEIRGTRTNLYEIAVQIHEWVHAHMTPNGTLGLPRTASAIYGDPRGVCRDYATLYTALARAAGVPTRMCAGIVAYQGRFYYHAWAESYVGGSTGWLPVDPTMPQMFVDATHVPLAKGDPAVMYTISGVIGEIKAQVLAATN